jgi:hypothetical protein
MSTLEALHDVLVGDLLACVGVHLQVLDSMAGCPVELWLNEIFSDSDVAG